MVDREVLHPPRAPELSRAFRLHPWQWVGIPLLMLLPVLAVFGILGETMSTVGVEAPGLRAELTYPARHRYRVAQSLYLHVTNTDVAPIDTLAVVLDADYASRFLVSMAFPEFDDAYTIRLHDIPAGATRNVRIDLEGRRYGWQDGELVITPVGREPIVIPLATFVFP